ncbi:unnamed protein product [Dicrocoelium dendriticum]|nr:unnamed protein product [Dicrocoelium dendriticum]
MSRLSEPAQPRCSNPGGTGDCDLDGEVIGSVPGTSTEFACLCGQKYASQRSLSQHKRHRHPDELNAERLEELPRRKGEWSKVECLLRYAEGLWTTGVQKQQMYEQLTSVFPGRSAEGIKKQLRKMSWRLEPYKKSAKGGTKRKAHESSPVEVDDLGRVAKRTKIRTPLGSPLASEKPSHAMDFGGSPLV